MDGIKLARVVIIIIIALCSLDVVAPRSTEANRSVHFEAADPNSRAFNCAYEWLNRRDHMQAMAINTGWSLHRWWIVSFHDFRSYLTVTSGGKTWWLPEIHDIVSPRGNIFWNRICTYLHFMMRHDEVVIGNCYRPNLSYLKISQSHHPHKKKSYVLFQKTWL